MLSLTLDDLNAQLERMREIPVKIDEASRQAWELKQEVALIQQEIDEFRWSIETEIICDKAKYPNKEARDLAITQKLNSDPGVQERRRRIAQKEEIKQMADRAVWKLKDEFTTVKYHVRASIAAIEGLTDPVVKEVLLGKRQANAID